MTKMNAVTDWTDLDRLVTVCASCHRACCWNFDEVCQDFRTADVKQMTVRQLIALGYEHPSNWSAK